jgi:hypothetical protein
METAVKPPEWSLAEASVFRGARSGQCCPDVPLEARSLEHCVFSAEWMINIVKRAVHN